MFKKIKEFLFGKPVVPVAGDATKGNDASWAEAKELSDVLTAIAAKKEAEAATPIVAPAPTKKKRTYVKREPKAEAPSTWPFPKEKPSEGVTLAELEALNAKPIPTPAMKVRKPRKAVVPKQD